MQVILRKDIPKLGQAGDIKNVSDGYGRNFLIARGLAETVSPQTLLRAKREAETRTMKMSAETTHYNGLATKLQETPLQIAIKIGAAGKAFGSVTSQDIAELAKRAGIPLEKEWIELEHGLKTTGEHEVPVKFPHGVTGTLRIVIESM